MSDSGFKMTEQRKAQHLTFMTEWLVVGYKMNSLFTVLKYLRTFLLFVPYRCTHKNSCGPLAAQVNTAVTLVSINMMFINTTSYSLNLAWDGESSRCWGHPKQSVIHTGTQSS